MNRFSLAAALLLSVAAGSATAGGLTDCQGALARMGAQIERLGGTLAAVGPVRPQGRLGDAEYASLSERIGSQIDAIQADEPAIRLIGPAASLLLSDTRDGLILMRTASHPAARHVGLLKVARDIELLTAASARLRCPPARKDL